jgi:hypothetical protein
MSLRLPARTVAPVVIFALVGGISASFVVYRSLPSGAESSFERPTPAAKRVQATRPATAKATKKKAVPAKQKAVPAKQKAVPAKQKAVPAKPKPTATRRAKVATPAPAVQTPAVRVPAPAKPKGDPVDARGLPLVLSRALAKHRVTVVALYDPRAAVDEMALAEARAGANDVNAGFVAISVRNEPQIRPLARLLGVLGSPAVLVYERPDTLFVRLDGFTDRQTVAQAAANAR